MKTLVTSYLEFSLNCQEGISQQFDQANIHFYDT